MRVHLEVSEDPHAFRIESLGDLGARVFTTFASYEVENGRQGVLYPERHIDRLFKNGEALGLWAGENPDKNAIVQNLLDEIKNHTPENTRVLIKVVLASSSSPLSVLIAPYKAPWNSGELLSAITTQEERMYPEFKTTSALPCLRARQSATLAKTHEAFLIDREGILREGAWSNIFWVTSKGRVRTTATRILPGITRGCVQELIEVEEIDLSLKEFRNEAVEIFITQATTGISPITVLDGVAIGSGRVGSVTANVMKGYRELQRSKGFVW